MCKPTKWLFLFGIVISLFPLGGYSYPFQEYFVSYGLEMGYFPFLKRRRSCSYIKEIFRQGRTINFKRLAEAQAFLRRTFQRFIRQLFFTQCALYKSFKTIQVFIGNQIKVPVTDYFHYGILFS
jgi:hypothetical protein